MAPLSPAQSARLILRLLQFTRKRISESQGFSVANFATLMAVCADPGAAQPDVAVAVGGIDPGTLSRHLNLLSGFKRPDSATEMPALVRTERNAVNRRLNDVFLTEDGEKFAADFAEYLNRLLARVDS